VEIGSVGGGSLAQSAQANTQQEVRRVDQQQRQAELETPAPQESAPQPGQRVGSLVDVSV
jgi:hypothetical protein